MKVLVIAQYFPPDMGGGATRANNMANGLSRRGCDVTVVTAFPHYPSGNIPSHYRGKLVCIEYEKKLKIIRTFVPPLASEGFTKRIFLFLSFILSSLIALPIVGKVDVVWAANPNIISMFPSVIYKIKNRCPVIQNVDDLWPEALYDLGMNSKSMMARLGEFISRIAYNIASVITPISPAYVNVLESKYNIQLSKIQVILAGVDLSVFSTHNVDVASKDQLFRVLYIGAFSPAYDFDQVFKAAKLLLDSTDIEFVIQGGGELGPVLKSQVKTLNLTNVKVIDKIVSRQEVVKVLHNADALLLPLNGIGSIEMGISSKLYEYQAVGKPIICCSNGQPGRYVSETKSGIIVKPGDYEMLSKAIIELKKNPQLAKKMGSNGRKYVETDASIDAIGLKMKNILEDLISK